MNDHLSGSSLTSMVFNNYFLLSSVNFINRCGQKPFFIFKFPANYNMRGYKEC
jgi:hypothetical protein